MRLKEALQTCGLSRHQYSHKPKHQKQGKKPTKVTNDGNRDINDDKLLEEIHRLRAMPDNNIGYRSICKQLHLLGYRVNHKKVYRIFKEHNLLSEKAKKPPKNYVGHRRVKSTRPLEVLEMDIKYVWMEKDRCHSFILTVIDTFTRVVLGWHASKKIQKQAVKDLWDDIIINHLQPADLLNLGLRVEVRNDNDKRFSAHLVQDYFKENQLDQVFTHPYTPQENGHIESFHAILSRSLNKQVFYTIQDLEQHLTLFYFNYNNTRSHSSTAYLPPMVFSSLWENQQHLFDLKVLQNNKVIIKCNTPLYKLSGIISQTEASCLNYKGSMPAVV